MESNRIMHNPYVVRTGVLDWFALKDQNADITDKILGLAGLRIELTWQDAYPLQDELLQLAPHEHWPTDEEKLAIYDQKLVIERSRHRVRGHGPRDTLTVTFSEGLDRRLNAPLFQYAAEQGWPYDQEAVFAAMDHTQTWTDVQEIRLISGKWATDTVRHTNNAMQLVLRGTHGNEMAHAQNTEIVTISDRFRLSNSLIDRLAQRLTEGLQLGRRHARGVDEYCLSQNPYIESMSTGHTSLRTVLRRAP
jgi:hypothetical protein